MLRVERGDGKCGNASLSRQQQQLQISHQLAATPEMSLEAEVYQALVLAKQQPEQALNWLAGLQQQLIANLRLGLSVFLSGDRESARQLLREKRRFRAQERRLAHAHVSRLQRKIVQSLETSSLHLELIADMKRLNSLFCSSAYVVLETSDTGALSAEDIADITHSP